MASTKNAVPSHEKGMPMMGPSQWGASSAKAEKLSAEIQQIRSQKAYARVGLPGLVEKAWWELKAAKNKLKLAKKAQKTGKKWLGRKAMKAGAGLGSIGKDLIEAFSARAKTRAEYLEAVYQHELAWAELEKSVGVEIGL